MASINNRDRGVRLRSLTFPRRPNCVGALSPNPSAPHKESSYQGQTSFGCYSRCHTKQQAGTTLTGLSGKNLKSYCFSLQYFLYTCPSHTWTLVDCLKGSPCGLCLYLPKRLCIYILEYRHLSSKWLWSVQGCWNHLVSGVLSQGWLKAIWGSLGAGVERQWV